MRALSSAKPRTPGPCRRGGRTVAVARAGAPGSAPHSGARDVRVGCASSNARRLWVRRLHLGAEREAAVDDQRLPRSSPPRASREGDSPAILRLTSRPAGLSAPMRASCGSGSARAVNTTRRDGVCADPERPQLDGEVATRLSAARGHERVVLEWCSRYRMTTRSAEHQRRRSGEGSRRAPAVSVQSQCLSSADASPHAALWTTSSAPAARLSRTRPDEMFPRIDRLGPSARNLGRLGSRIRRVADRDAAWRRARRSGAIASDPGARPRS